MNIFDNLVLKDVVLYNPNKSGDYVVIVPNLNGLASITLKLMMYRLNNIEGDVTVYITDKKSVTQKDIDSGIYTEDDFGKFRVDVFIDKVAVNFDISTCDVVKQKNFMSLNLDDKNIIYLDVLDSKVNRYELFEKFLTSKAFKRFQTNNIYIQVGNNKGLEFVRVDCFSRKTYLSDTVEEEVKMPTKTNKRVREAIMSRIVSGIVNIMVTEDFVLSKNKYTLEKDNTVIMDKLKEVE